jgi:hypothetical protein
MITKGLREFGGRSRQGDQGAEEKEHAGDLEAFGEVEDRRADADDEEDRRESTSILRR